jgi:hypothetical protein
MTERQRLPNRRASRLLDFEACRLTQRANNLCSSYLLSAQGRACRPSIDHTEAILTEPVIAFGPDLTTVGIGSPCNERGDPFRHRNGRMRENTTLTQAAQILESHPMALRKTFNRFGFVERDNRRRRLIPIDVLALFRRTKAASGYLYPRSIRTRTDLLAAAAEIPQSEITELIARTAASRKSAVTPD